MKRTHHFFSVLIVGVAMLALAACAGVTTPKTPDQAVYAAYGTYVAVGNTAADYKQAGLIDEATAVAAQKRLQEARPIIEGAKSTVESGGTPSEGVLDAVRAAQQALLEIQNRMINEQQQEKAHE